MTNQFSLFDESLGVEELINRDGKASYHQNYFDNPKEVFEKLTSEIPWQQDQIAMFGKIHDIPRMQAWFGEGSYSYSGISLKVHPWNETLINLKTIIERKTGHLFNSALVNLYRDGSDHVSWHADDEKELGKNPIIASISFGESRKISFKHCFDKGVDIVSKELEDNSLLLMEGSLQHFWHHRIHKTTRKIGSRINVTFRKLV